MIETKKENHSDYDQIKAELEQLRKEKQQWVKKQQETITNPQTYLDLYYPKENRHKIEILSIHSRNLTGKLDLRDFPNLKILLCHINRLTELDISQNNQLRIIEAYRNRIKADIDCFSHLTELKKLNLGVGSEGFSISPNDLRFINNQYYGSLESLKHCKQLEELCIGYQWGIKEGLKHLPTANLKEFGCQGTVFQDWLKTFDYDVEAWKLFYFPEEVFEREYTPNELLKKLQQKLADSQWELMNIKENQNKLVVVGKLRTTKDWRPKIERLEQKIGLIEVKIEEVEEEMK